jgi:hypothetical protein
MRESYMSWRRHGACYSYMHAAWEMRRCVVSSVAGVEMMREVGFTVEEEEDDVPELN